MGLFCNECKTTISLRVYQWSNEKLGRPLCMSCQGSVKSKSSGSKRSSSVREGVPATSEEYALYQALLDEGFEEDELVLNKKADKKHVDISVLSAQVNIEVDGLHHQTDPKQALADIKRMYYSFKKGWYTVRVPNSLVRSENLRETARYLKKIIEASEDELNE